MTERRHYPALDGLRGVAAIAVAAFHLWTVLGLRQEPGGWFAHGYLGVDFFFCLSGFVVAEAYRDRLISGAMPVREFALVRLIRLWPLLAMVAGLAALSRIALVAAGRPMSDDSVAGLLIDAACGLLLMPEVFANHADTVIFPLNGPTWSVFYELVVNLIWAAALIRLRAGTLAIIAAACLLLLLKPMIHYSSIHFGVSRGLDMVAGLARTTWSFLIGAILAAPLLSRVRVSVPFEVAAFILGAALVMPVAGWMVDAVSVGVIFPLLILFGRDCRPVVGDGPVRALGELSFPLYAIHLPLLMTAALFIGRSAPRFGLIWGVPMLALLVLLARVVHHRVDVPVRTWLTRACRRRRLLSTGTVGGLPN